MADNNDDVIAALTEALVNSETVYGLIAPIKVPAMMIDGGAYRHIAMEGNEEFFLAGVRAGARDQMIFEFKPLDDKPYSQAEFHEGVVFTAFPELEAAAVKALGANDVGFPTARKRFTKRILEEKRAKTKTEEATAHSGNPLWGMFS